MCGGDPQLGHNDASEDKADVIVKDLNNKAERVFGFVTDCAEELGPAVPHNAADRNT